MTLTEDRVEVELPGVVGRTHPVTRQARRRWPSAVGVVAVVSLSVWVAGIGREPIVNSRGWSEFAQFFGAAIHPRLDATFLDLTWNAAIVTLAYALLGTALALVIGAVFGVISSDAWLIGGTDRSGAQLVRRAVRIGLVPLRSIHEAIYALLLVRVLGLNPLVAVLAIAIPFGAVTARVFAQMLDDVNPNAARELVAQGAGRGQAFLYATLPNAVRDLTSYAFYRFECGLRSAAVLGVIGAAGLGYQLKLSFQSLRYDEIWTLLFALIILCGLGELLSNRVRHSTVRARTALAPRVDGEARNLRRRPRPVIIGLITGCVIGVPWAWWHLGVDVSTLWAARATDAATRLASELVPPNADGGIGHVFDITIETLAMSVIALSIAATLACGAAFVGARRPGGRRSVVASAMRIFLLFTRTIPPPIWAFVLLFLFLPGVVPGALALAIYTFGVLGRLMGEVVDHVDPGPGDRLRATGASGAQEFLYDRVPRVAPSFVALGLYRWEVATRETVVVGIVAAGGLGYAINQQLAAFDYHALAGSLIALAVLTLVAELVTARMRRAWS